MIFSTSQWTRICSILFFDSLSEYPFAIIAAGIFTLISELMWLSHTKKNSATFAVQRSTRYSFLFDDILSFQAQEKWRAIWLVVGKENLTHRGATISLASQDYGSDPQGSEPANYDGFHYYKVLDVTIGVQN
jgi:hypothetical protein